MLHVGIIGRRYGNGKQWGKSSFTPLLIGYYFSGVNVISPRLVMDSGDNSKVSLFHSLKRSFCRSACNISSIDVAGSISTALKYPFSSVLMLMKVYSVAPFAYTRPLKSA